MREITISLVTYIILVSGCFRGVLSLIFDRIERNLKLKIEVLEGKIREEAVKHLEYYKFKMKDKKN